MYSVKTHVLNQNLCILSQAVYSIKTHVFNYKLCIQSKTCIPTESSVSYLQGIPTIGYNELVVQDQPPETGGFKRVYKATWALGGSLGAKQVAVLELKRDDGSLSNEISMFLKAGRHPHLVQLLAVARRSGGGASMVLEYAPSGSIDQVLGRLQDQNQRPSNAVVLTAAGQVCFVAPILVKSACGEGLFGANTC
jgi:hypothetical protein